jgi:hypothetical protein
MRTLITQTINAETAALATIDAAAKSIQKRSACSYPEAYVQAIRSNADSYKKYLDARDNLKSFNIP